MRKEIKALRIVSEFLTVKITLEKLQFCFFKLDRFTATGFYQSVASRIGHGSGFLALLTALILIALRLYVVIALDDIKSFTVMSQALFVLVELYIVYGLIMLKVVTAKLPPGYNQIQPNRGIGAHKLSP